MIGYPRGGISGTSESWDGAHNTSLAAFLMGMDEQSYFGSGLHWTDRGWNIYWPEFKHYLGRPKGEHSARFSCIRASKIHFSSLLFSSLLYSINLHRSAFQERHFVHT